MAEKLTHILTFSRVYFDPCDPQPEHIMIEDIAHALSYMCRANGHFNQFFSVAQHSLNCVNEAQACGLSKDIQLACLLHDASEAYLSDITRPVKANMPEYQRFEEKLQNMIYSKFMGARLSESDFKDVARIDNEMLYYEFLKIMEVRLFDKELELKSSPPTEFEDFAKVEEKFLSEFYRLT